jgi:hypothetical protein
VERGKRGRDGTAGELERMGRAVCSPGVAYDSGNKKKLQIDTPRNASIPLRGVSILAMLLSSEQEKYAFKESKLSL